MCIASMSKSSLFGGSGRYQPHHVFSSCLMYSAIFNKDTNKTVITVQPYTLHHAENRFGSPTISVFKKDDITSIQTALSILESLHDVTIERAHTIIDSSPFYSLNTQIAQQLNNLQGETVHVLHQVAQGLEGLTMVSRSMDAIGAFLPGSFKIAFDSTQKDRCYSFHLQPRMVFTNADKPSLELQLLTFDRQSSWVMSHQEQANLLEITGMIRQQTHEQVAERQRICPVERKRVLDLFVPERLSDSFASISAMLVMFHEDTKNALQDVLSDLNDGDHEAWSSSYEPQAARTSGGAAQSSHIW